MIGTIGGGDMLLLLGAVLAAGLGGYLMWRLPH